MKHNNLFRNFSIYVRIDSGDVSEKITPFSVEIDFGRYLKKAEIKGRFARHSVIVTKLFNGNETIIPHSISEHFLYEDKGEVSWVIEEPDELEYKIYFDIEENGKFAPPAKIALVGNGDVLRYNSRVTEPIDVAIPVQMPVFTDWSGDARLDMIQGSTYANTIGFPYHGTWFFRNVGSNEKPFYEDFVRLQADGEFIDTQVFAAIDWNGNGQIDLIAKPYGKNEIHVYFNTGERDRNGLPILTKDDVIDLSEVMGPGGQCGLSQLQLVNLYGDGRLHLVGAYRDLADKSKYGHIFGPYYDNYLIVFENESSAGKPPKFKQPYKITFANGSVLSLKGTGGGTICDWNDDGVWDVIVNEFNPQTCNHRLRLFHNIGSNEKPELIDAGILADREGFLAANYYRNESYHGFIVTEKNRIFRYLKASADSSGKLSFRDKGWLPQRNGRVSVFEYAWPCVCDWDGDSGRDIVAGNSDGTPSVIEEVGRFNPPIFRPRKFLEANGEPIRLVWGNTIGQTGGECTEGYWQPAIVDWDNDGLDDMIASVGIEAGKMVEGKPAPDGRLYFFKNIGAREHPRYDTPRPILLEDGSPPMSGHLAFPVDWDGDSRYELLGFDMQGRLCVFKLKDNDNPHIVFVDKILKMYDGTEFSNQTVFDILGYMWGLQAVVCDWDNRGVWDIIVGTKEMLLLFRNTGTNSEPVYAKGEELKLWGNPIRHSLHTLRPWPVDWDNTGRVDLLVGAESGWFHLFRRSVFDNDHKPAYTFGEFTDNGKKTNNYRQLY